MTYLTAFSSALHGLAGHAPARRARGPLAAGALVLAGLLAAPAAAPAQETVSTEASAEVPSEAAEENFKGWSVRCMPREDRRDCAAYTTGEGAQLIVAALREGDIPARIALHVPPTAAKGDPIALYLDSDVSFQTQVWDCTENFCEAQVAPEAVGTVLLRLIADTEGMIIYKLADDIHMVPVTLTEFDKAWKAARK